MESLAAVLVQLAVAVLTVSISFDLNVQQFAALLRAPRALVTGLLAQLGIVPLLVLLVATTPQPATLLTALCLVAFTPSGPTSNYLAHLARADVPLAVLLTVLGTLLSAAVMPFGVPALLRATTGTDLLLVTPAAVFESLFWMVLLPLLGGLYAARRHPALVARIRRPANRVAALLFVLLIGAAIGSQWELLVRTAAAAAVPVLLINIAALVLGNGIGRAAGLARPQWTALGLKAAVQNVSIAIGVAIGVLGRFDVAAVAALYGVTQLLVTTTYALLLRRFDGARATSSRPVG
jgi:BASS family bile acid:Na+ symporter